MKHVLNQRALFWFWKYCHFGCFGRVNKRLSNCYVLPQWKTETRTKFDSLLFTLPKQPKWSKVTRHLVQNDGKNHNISTFYTVFVNAWTPSHFNIDPKTLAARKLLYYDFLFGFQQIRETKVFIIMCENMLLFTT